MGTRVCVGRIGAPHGVRGLLVVRSHTAEPHDIAGYGPLTLGDGRELRLEVVSAKKAGLICKIDGIDSREAAGALTGHDLYVDRDALPPPEPDEFYHADLVGLLAEDTGGGRLGRVVAVHDFGAGDMIEIDPGDGDTVFLPFTAAVVPEIDIAGGRIVAAPPQGAFAAAKQPS